MTEHNHINLDAELKARLDKPTLTIASMRYRHGEGSVHKLQDLREATDEVIKMLDIKDTTQVLVLHPSGNGTLVSLVISPDHSVMPENKGKNIVNITYRDPKNLDEVWFPEQRGNNEHPEYL